MGKFYYGNPDLRNIMKNIGKKISMIFLGMVLIILLYQSLLQHQELIFKSKEQNGIDPMPMIFIRAHILPNMEVP